MSTGGPASEKTLLDEFAGQALPWCLSEFAGNSEDGTQYAPAAYHIAEAMLAEKARREGVVQESSTTHDDGKVAELQAANRELVEALDNIIDGWVDRNDDAELATKARAILSKHKGAA